MRPGAIDDIVRRANGSAARMVGQPFVLHRPQGSISPVRSGTARMRMPALFVPQKAGLPSHGHPAFEAIVDSAYTHVGDYLVGAAATYLVVSKRPLEPLICVRTTRTLSFSRLVSQPAGGAGTYGGFARTSTDRVLTNWPASVIEAGTSAVRAGLPTDLLVGGWSVLLALTSPIVLQTGDLMTDDLGRAGVVAAAELSEHGWRLLVRQAAT